jgi:hypothetical protein
MAQRRVDERKAEEQEALSEICTSLSQDAGFMKMVEDKVVPVGLDAYIAIKAQVIGRSKVMEHVQQPFRFLYRRLARLKAIPPACPPSVADLLSAFPTYSTESNTHKVVCRNLGNRIGFSKSARHKSKSSRRMHTRQTFVDVNSHVLDIEVIGIKRLPILYPPPKHIVLESKSEPIPDPQEIVDRTCSSCTNYHVLDESRLPYTIPADKSAIMYDSEKRIVAVVIRDCAEGSFPLIKEWGVDLIRNEMPRRRKVQRNGPGQLAIIGASSGRREKEAFGWVANLLSKVYARSDERDTNDSSLCSLFGLFYALARARLPSDIIEAIENTVESAKLPRMDYEGKGEFTIPLGSLPSQRSVAFSLYPLSPPGGYIGVDYLKHIHKDGHWRGCPWAMY